uniref:U88 n=1 Tax=Solanum tuberosum TaxID=4113 RepID=M1APX3_SOLTU
MELLSGKGACVHECDKKTNELSKQSCCKSAILFCCIAIHGTLHGLHLRISFDHQGIVVAEAAWKTVEAVTSGGLAIAWSTIALLVAVALTSIFEKEVVVSADGGTAVLIAGSTTFVARAAVSLIAVFEKIDVVFVDGGATVLIVSSATFAVSAA